MRGRKSVQGKEMNKKARGVTLDTQLPKKEEAVKSVDGA